jgi:hypothetical protein
MKDRFMVGKLRTPFVGGRDLKTDADIQGKADPPSAHAGLLSGGPIQCGKV